MPDDQSRTTPQCSDTNEQYRFQRDPTSDAISARPANDEMVRDYMDGWDLNAPEPSDNRSHSYRHGFANARDDRRGKPRASFEELNRMADLAMTRDEALQHGR